MKCPHCFVDFHAYEKVQFLCKDLDGYWGVSFTECSACGRSIVRLIMADGFNQLGDGYWAARGTRHVSHLVRPKATDRAPISPQVPSEIAKDYVEACLVLEDSPRASAALSRRCLQHLLRKYAGVTPSNLSGEIEEVLSKKLLPPQLAELLDEVCDIGNFAVHPIKSTAPSEIAGVEPGEAEWNLDMLEALFDFLFVEPAVLKARRDALNKILADAGKPPLKASIETAVAAPKFAHN
jgi:hypothetical protein